MAARQDGVPAHGWTATDRLDSFDCTLANLSEILFDCLDAARARSVAEIGAEHGLCTEKLLDWAARSGAERVVAVDPTPRPRLQALAAAHPQLDLVVKTSHQALPGLSIPDAIIIDGDHNYFTVSEELRLIAERAYGAQLPLLMLHDVGWPLGRRDAYDEPARIPGEWLQPIAERAFLLPDDPGIAPNGLYYERTAIREGGPRNGVLTAVEDFVRARSELRLALIAPFFGLAVVWHSDASWAEAMASTVAQWDRNALLERIERKRIHHLVAEFQNLQEIDALRSKHYDMAYDMAAKLLPIYESSAIVIAEHLSRLRQGGRPNFSRDTLGDVLTQLAGEGIDLDEMRNGNGPSERDGAPRIGRPRRAAADSA